jgi:hypothetical protein
MAFKKVDTPAVPMHARAGDIVTFRVAWSPNHPRLIGIGTLLDNCVESESYVRVKVHWCSRNHSLYTESIRVFPEELTGVYESVDKARHALAIEAL